MNQGEHNGFSECGWFVCLSVGIGTQANPVNPVILSKKRQSGTHEIRKGLRRLAV